MENGERNSSIYAALSGAIALGFFIALMIQYNTARFYNSIYRYYPCDILTPIYVLNPQPEFIRNETKSITCYKYRTNDKEIFFGDEYKVQEWLWAGVVFFTAISAIIIIRIRNND